jgi:hypothetical protein
VRSVAFSTRPDETRWWVGERGYACAMLARSSRDLIMSLI